MVCEETRWNAWNAKTITAPLRRETAIERIDWCGPEDLARKQCFQKLMRQEFDDQSTCNASCCIVPRDGALDLYDVQALRLAGRR